MNLERDICKSLPANKDVSKNAQMELILRTTSAKFAISDVPNVWELPTTVLRVQPADLSSTVLVGTAAQASY